MQYLRSPSTVGLCVGLLLATCFKPHLNSYFICSKLLSGWEQPIDDFWAP